MSAVLGLNQKLVSYYSFPDDKALEGLIKNNKVMKDIAGNKLDTLARELAREFGSSTIDNSRNPFDAIQRISNEHEIVDRKDPEQFNKLGQLEQALFTLGTIQNIVKTFCFASH